MAKVGDINSMLGQQFNIVTANTLGKNIKTNNSLINSSMIIAAENKDGNDTGNYSLWVTDSSGAPARLTYCIKPGNGLKEFTNEENEDYLGLNIDGTTLTITQAANGADHHNEGEDILWVNAAEFVDNETVKTISTKQDSKGNNINKIYVNAKGIADGDTISSTDNNKLKVNTNKLTKSASDTYGVVKPDNDTITTNDGVLSVNLYGLLNNITGENKKNDDYTHTNIIVVPGNTQKDPYLKVNTETLDPATTTTPGVVRADGRTIGIANGVINVNTTKLTYGTASTRGVFLIDDNTITTIRKDVQSLIGSEGITMGQVLDGVRIIATACGEDFKEGVKEKDVLEKLIAAKIISEYNKTYKTVSGKVAEHITDTIKALIKTMTLATTNDTDDTADIWAALNFIFGLTMGDQISWYEDLNQFILKGSYGQQLYLAAYGNITSETQQILNSGLPCDSYSTLNKLYNVIIETDVSALLSGLNADKHGATPTNFIDGLYELLDSDYTSSSVVNTGALTVVTDNLDPATTTSRGVVKIKPGGGLLVETSGDLYVNTQGLTQASETKYGVVKYDNTSIQLNETGQLIVKNYGSITKQLEDLQISLNQLTERVIINENSIIKLFADIQNNDAKATVTWNGADLTTMPITFDSGDQIAKESTIYVTTGRAWSFTASSNADWIRTVTMKINSGSAQTTNVIYANQNIGQVTDDNVTLRIEVNNYINTVRSTRRGFITVSLFQANTENENIDTSRSIYTFVIQVTQHAKILEEVSTIRTKLYNNYIALLEQQFLKTSSFTISNTGLAGYGVPTQVVIEDFVLKYYQTIISEDKNILKSKLTQASTTNIQDITDSNLNTTLNTTFKTSIDNNSILKIYPWDSNTIETDNKYYLSLYTAFYGLIIANQHSLSYSNQYYNYILSKYWYVIK